LDSGQEVASALGIGAETRFGGCSLVHFGPRGEMHYVLRLKLPYSALEQFRIENIDIAPEC
jgi:hypothetical protein